MNNEEINFCFVVGGRQEHYDNMQRSIISIKKLIDNANFCVLELGQKKIKSEFGIKVIHKDVDFSNKKKIGYLFWKEKYNVVQYCDSEYIIYVDTDTVFVNNNINDLFNKIGDNIGVCQHFWIPYMSFYESYAVSPQYKSQYVRFRSKYHMEPEDKFWSGGVFLFKNSKDNLKVFNEINNISDEFYGKNEYISGSGITDELFFSYSLNKRNKYSQLNGALNHCIMGDQYMRLKIENGIIFGKNTYEENWEPVTFFHCDINRRNPPAQSYSDEINKEVNKAYNI